MIFVFLLSQRPNSPRAAVIFEFIHIPNTMHSALHYFSIDFAQTK